MKQLFSIILLLVMLNFDVWGQGIIYVDSSQTHQTTNGNSWSTAFNDLENALSIADSGDTIVVAKGTYLPSVEWDVYYGWRDSYTDRNATFKVPSGVKLWGGFSGKETFFDQETLDNRNFETNKTILSGDLGVKDDNTDNALHVVLFYHVNSLTEFDGFTVSHGNSNQYWQNGSAVFNNGIGTLSSSRPKISNCKFTWNNGSGAICNYGRIFGDANSEITDCYFSKNSGPCIYNIASTDGESSPIITNCKFEDNYGNPIDTWAEGGTSSFILKKCAFENNKVSRYKGSINMFFLWSNTSSPQIDSCIFFQNGEGLSGGIMISAEEGSGRVLVTNSLFSKNEGYESGAIYSISGIDSYIDLSVGNCIFSKNSGFWAGAIHSATHEGGAKSEIFNSTFFGNTGSKGAAVYFNNPHDSASGFWNCIFDEHLSKSDSTFKVRNSKPTIAYSLLEESSTAELTPLLSVGSGVIFGSDPEFIDTTNGDFSLAKTSIAIDAGENKYVPDFLKYDFIGDPRIQGAAVDLGAYETKGILTSLNFGEQQEVKFYPNPASGNILLDLDDFQGTSTIDIKKVNGVQVLSKSVDAPGFTEISLDGLENGIYYIRVSNGSKYAQSKIFKY